MSDNNPRHPTRVEHPSARRETKYQPGDNPLPPPRQEPSPARANPDDNRKIVGVLATYTWKAEGELFPVREARTHIGAGHIKEDTTHRQVDVHCPRDGRMSEDHAIITVQNRKYWIRDLDSTNGTFLNQTQLPPHVPQELPDHAEIKAGDTIFTFIKIEPKSEPVTLNPAPVAKAAAEPSSERDKTLLR